MDRPRYVTPTKTSGGREARDAARLHVAGSVLTALASGVVFLTVSSVAWIPERPLSSAVVLLVGALLVAVPVTATRAWEHGAASTQLDWPEIATPILYGLAVVPAPFTVLLILDYGLSGVELRHPLVSAALVL